MRRRLALLLALLALVVGAMVLHARRAATPPPARPPLGVGVGAASSGAPVVRVHPSSLMLDGAPVDEGPSRLEVLLRERRERGGATTVLVEADEDVPFARVRAVARICERAGYGTVLFSVAGADASAPVNPGH